MKITAKTTKEQLKHILGANVTAVKKQDKDLYDRIAYASKMAKADDSKVTRKDLVDLVKEVMKVLGDKLVEPALAQETPVAENSVKKLSKGVSKKQETKKEEPSTEVVESENTAEETQETPAKEVKTEEKVDTKKSAKKSLGKKKEQPKKDGVTALDNNEKTVQMAKMFPKTLEVGDTKYELATDIKTMEDLHKALANDEEITFAYYWTKRHLKQFPYYGGLLGQPKSFDNDLDLANAIYVSDEFKVCYQVSAYTEALYAVVPTDLEEEDGIRYNNGMEYQIYRAV